VSTPFSKERLSANIEAALHKALIIFIMTYACPALVFTADSYLLKVLRSQIKVVRTTGNFPRRTQIRCLHVAYKIPYSYDLIAKLCRQQSELI
jgi:hypothetical protein